MVREQAPETPYLVELWLSRSQGGAVVPGQYDVDLFDRERQAVQAAGVANLGFGAEPVPGLHLACEQFLSAFHRGDAGGPDDGLVFGRELLRRLIKDPAIERLWQDIQDRRRAQRRPLRLELVLPATDVQGVAEIPFELLADDQGFLFQRFGASVIRVIEGLDARSAELRRDASILVAWANPDAGVDERLPAALLQEHEEKTAAAARKLGLVVKEPIRQASRRTLEERLFAERPVEVVSLVAHGDPAGGAVWLHDDAHSSYPDDPGAPASASELATALRRAQAEVALLWSCHGARRHPIAGAVAAALLHPDGANLAAVVSAHAALRAEGTQRIAEALLDGLRGVAEGDLERAVGEARRVRSDSDLQWAALVYYARPRAARTVTLEQAVEAEVASWRTPPVAAGVVVVEGAPPPSRYFRGRQDEIARVLALLRQRRVVSVTGMAGIGKTELTLEVARRAVKDEALGLERALWLPIEQVRTAEELRVRIGLALGAEPKSLETDAGLVRFVGARRLLVILDNAEDVIRADRAGVQALVEALMAGAPGVRLLLSTRVRLGDVRSAEEGVQPLGKLPPGPAREAFLAAAGPRLTAAAQRSEDFEELLKWLDGHPLSLMLVAGLVGAFPLGELRARLAANELELVVDEAFLDDDLSDVDAAKLRTKRLVSSLDLSFLPLKEKHPAAAEVFAWLSCFPEGLPAVLVPHVFGAGAERQVGVLQRANLVEEQGAVRRLVLPTPVRAYAARQAAAIPEERRLALVTASFGALAGWLGGLRQKVGEPGARDAMVQAAAEEGSLWTLAGTLGATSAAVAKGTASSLAEKIAEVFNHFGYLLGYADRVRPAILLGERLRPILEAHPGSFGLACFEEDIGDLYVRADRLEDAEAAYLRALHAYQSLGARLGEASTERELGDLYVQTGRLEQAEAAYGRALPIFQELLNRSGEANVRNGMADLALFNRKSIVSFAHSLEARSLFQAMNEQIGIAGTDLRLGRAALAGQHPLRAIYLLRRALNWYEETEDRYDQMLALFELARALAVVQQEEAAKAAFVLAWHHAAAVEDPRAAKLAERNRSEPPSEAVAFQARILLTATLSDLVAQFEATGEDPYSPLPPPDPAP